MPFDPDTVTPPGARIKVIGVGGGGGNAVNTMIRSGLDGVDFVACNTDVQALRFSLAAHKIQVGKELTRGLGAGADPDVGRDAALEDRLEIEQYLQGADMVFITAGMGGGTGTGGAAVVAQIARELGALTVAVVTKPFTFEGKRRRKHSDLGVSRLRESVDTLITIPNQRLLQVAAPGLSMIDAFKMADEVLVNAVRGISDIINIPGVVNVDFADVKTVMSCMGQALMGIGRASGEGRAVAAARQAICSPLLEDIDIEGATGILVNITASSNVSLMEVNEACSIIQEAAHEDANFIFGSVIDETLGEELRVTVIATGFPIDTTDEETAAATAKPQAAAASNHAPSRINLTTTPAAPRPAPRATAPAETPHAETAPYEAPRTRSEGLRLNALGTNVGASEPAVTASTSATSVTANNGVIRPEPLVDFERVTPPSARETAQRTAQEAQELMRWTLAGTENAESLDQGPDFTSPTEDTSAALSASSLSRDVPEVSAPNDDELSLSVDDGPIDLSPNGCDAELADKRPNAARIEGARAIVDPQDDFLGSTDLDPSLVFDTSAIDFELGHDGGARDDGSLLRDPAPLESFFASDGTHIASDIDRKIDEALELAERIKAPKSAAIDDLDVPAFLRNGMKDLPLG